MRRMKAMVIVLGALIILSGCAATQTAIEKKDLLVTSEADRAVFVTPGLGNRVFVQARNVSTLKITSEEFQNHVVQGLQARGFTVVQNPADADYTIQAQFLSAEADIVPARMRGSTSDGGAAGAVAGAVIGGLAGSWKATGIGAGVGGIVGNLAETVSGSLVRDVTYRAKIAVKVTDRTGQNAETTITVNVSQVNLRPEVGTPILLQECGRAIANLL